MGSDRALKAGDVVEVRSAAEILASLDERGALGALPFMPEMVALSGRRFVFDKRADKICDTIGSSGSRRLRDTVLLKDLRCDGSGHDGCQAECRIFWRSEWLRRVEPGPPPVSQAVVSDATTALAGLAAANAKETSVVERRPVDRYRCQATELLVASERLVLWDPRIYLRELASGNVPLGRLVRVMARAVAQIALRAFRLASQVAVSGATGKSLAEPPRGLRAGERVRVKTRREIAMTLNTSGRNRGLLFDREMLQFCGKTFQVGRRVQQFIDDRTGQMIRPQTHCFTLEGVVCSGDHHISRLFCPRAIYPYWRESWLTRDPDDSAIVGSRRADGGP